MALLVKICGIRDEAALDAAIEAGADMVGFVFFERSPRHLALDRAASLVARAGRRARRVALTVDADDATLDAIVAQARPDLLQMHGGETPERVAAVKARHGLPTIRALRIGSPRDLAAAAAFEKVADYLLFDAPPPVGADRPGGHGALFDWGLLAGAAPSIPWLLAGGLDAGNVAEALVRTGAAGVDVSSGVESAPGIKDPARIAAFVRAARAATEPAPARAMG